MDIAAINAAIAPSRTQLANESLAFLGGGWVVGDCSLKPVTLGGLMLMETIGLPWVTGGDVSSDAIKAAAVILEHREDAVGICAEAVAADDPIATLAVFCLHEIDVDIAALLINNMMQIAVTGFNFFGRGEKGAAGFCGAEFAASVCRTCGELGMTTQQILWREPLARLGFILAAAARWNGEKNIGRENTLDWGRAMELAKQQAQK